MLLSQTLFSYLYHGSVALKSKLIAPDACLVSLRSVDTRHLHCQDTLCLDADVSTEGRLVY